MKRGLGSLVPLGAASSPVLGSVSAICIHRCSKAPPSGRKIASMVKSLAPTSGRGRKNSAVSLPLNSTALPTGLSTSSGAPSTLGVRPPMLARLLNFQTCADAEVVSRQAIRLATMLHLLIISSRAWPCVVPAWRDVDASAGPLQSPAQQEQASGDRYDAIDLCRARADAGPDAGSRASLGTGRWREWARAHRLGRAQSAGIALHRRPTRPIWHIADILKAHQGQASWDQPVMLTRDFDGHYVSHGAGREDQVHVLCR